MRRFNSLGLFLLMIALVTPVLAGEPKPLDKTAIGPFESYCDGYGLPGATGLGYVSVLKVSTGVVDEGDDALLDGIVAYDRAEANDAYIGQINMITASSFNGLTGSIWGYDLAVAEDIARHSQQPVFSMTQYDGTALPVFDAAPLLKAGEALFGTAKARRFPPDPGSQVICANKSATVLRPKTGVPDPDKGQGYGAWCYIAISIAKDRTKAASLFIEDCGVWTKNDSEKDLRDFLDEHRRSVVKSVLDCGRNQGVVYERTYISYAYVIMKPGQVGTALTVAPYVVLARKAVPEGGFAELGEITLKEWERKMGF